MSEEKDDGKPIRECAFREHDERVRGINVTLGGEPCHIPITDPERLRRMFGEEEPTTASGIYARHRATVANLAQVKQDSRLWSPADMIRNVASEMENNVYQGKSVTKAAVVLYADDGQGDRGVVVLQAQCSMLELAGLLKAAGVTVDKALVG